MPDLVDLVARHAAWLVFAATLAARIGAPVPAAPVLAIAGAAAASFASPGPVFAGLLVLAWIGNVIGDGLWFWAGQRYGYSVLKLLCRISMSPDSCVRQSEAFISRWGGSSLVAAKFVPGVSVVAPPMAGALGMSWWGFLGYETLASLLWSGLLLGLGAAFGDQIRLLLAWMSAFGVYAIAGTFVAVLLWVAWRYARRWLFLRGTGMARVTVGELRVLLDSPEPPLVVDVRSGAGRGLDRRRIPGAVEVELSQVARMAGQWPRDREVVLYCDCPNEASAASAARILAEHGYTRARPLAGGLSAWVAAGHAIEGAPTVEPVPA